MCGCDYHGHCLLNQQEIMDEVRSSPLIAKTPLSSSSAVSHCLLIWHILQRNVTYLCWVMHCVFEPYPSPMLFCGQAGSGKSRFERGIARFKGLEIHVNVET